MQGGILFVYPLEGGKKKLVAGVRWSLHISDSGAWDCRECDERTRKKRNCRNRHGVLHEMLERPLWFLVPKLQHIAKIVDTKFYVCPVGLITQKTWRIVQLVNDTTDADCHILQLPFPGSFMDQPEWYKEAVRIVRRERSEARARKVKKPGKRA